MAKAYYEEKTKIYFDAWDYEVNIVLSSNLDASINRRDKSHKFEGKTAGICMPSSSGRPQCLIILPYRPKASLIAHESWHAVRNILDYCGANYDSETVAYHLGYLVRQICSFEQKHPRPKSKRAKTGTGNGQ